MSPTAIAAYLTLFAGVAFFFVLIALLLGRLVRPSAPSAVKAEPYECGEPPVGTAYVQFDLRFYVVALVFLIFEVEVAFFFPWATVFGKLRALQVDSSPAAVATVLAEMELPHSPEANLAGVDQAARELALASMVDIAVFFGVLLVGFAYLWKRGDLDWVYAMPDRATMAPAPAHGTYNPVPSEPPEVEEAHLQ
ncbi:MAG: NADH-quinone oxidoreductase subunit A [Planctomycetota bacterium]